jgi:hypothetical protein
MSANSPKVPGALFAGACCHGIQPSIWILLSNALWHRSQIFGVDPSAAVLFRHQDRIDIATDDTGVGRFCSCYVSGNSQSMVDSFNERSVLVVLSP